MKQLILTKEYMTPEKLLEASETLTWLSENLNGLSKEGTMLSISCQIPNIACLQLAYQMQNGVDVKTALSQVVANVKTSN